MSGKGKTEKGKRKRRRRRRVLEDSDSLGGSSASDSYSSEGNSIGNHEKDFEHDRQNARRRAILQIIALSSDEGEIEHEEEDDDGQSPHQHRLTELSDINEEVLETALGPFNRSTFLMPEGEKAAMGLPMDIPNYLNEESDSEQLTTELRKKIEWLSNDGLRNFEKALRNLKSRIWSMHPTEAREEIVSLKTFGLHRLIRGGIDIAKWCYRVLDNRNEGKYRCELEVADLRLDPLDSRIDDSLRELRSLERSYGNSLDRKFEIEEGVVEEDAQNQQESQEILQEYEAEEVETSTKLSTTSGRNGSNPNLFQVKRRSENHDATKDGLKGDDLLLSPRKEGDDFMLREKVRQVVKKRLRRPDDEHVHGHSSLLRTPRVGLSGEQQCRESKKMTREYCEPFKPFHVRYEERQQRAAAMATNLKTKKRGIGGRRRREHQSKTRVGRGDGHGGVATPTGGWGGASKRRKQKGVVMVDGQQPKSSRYGMNEGGSPSLLPEGNEQGEESQMQAQREHHRVQKKKMYRLSSPHRNRTTYLPNHLRSLVEDLISLPTNTNRHLPSGGGGAAKPIVKPSDDTYAATAKGIIDPEIWNSDFISALKSDKKNSFDCIYTQTLNDRIADVSTIALAVKDCKQGLGQMERKLRNEWSGAAIPYSLPFRRFIQYKEGTGLVICQPVSKTVLLKSSSFSSSTAQSEEQKNLLLVTPEEDEEGHDRRKGSSGDAPRHTVPEVFLLLCQIVDYDNVLSNMHIVRACCSAMAVLSHIPICRRWECSFIDGAKHLAERVMMNGGLGKSLMQLDDVMNHYEAETAAAEFFILNDEDENNHKRKIPHGCYLQLELHCAIRCRLLEWLRTITLEGDCCFIRFSRELLLELLDLYERFPRSVAIKPVTKVLEDKQEDDLDTNSPSSNSNNHNLVVISSPIINLWCRLLCSVDGYIRNDLKSFWSLFHQTIFGLGMCEGESKGSMAVESVWSVVIYVVRLYILIGYSSDTPPPPVHTVYNPDFWNILLLLLHAGPLSIGPPGIRKKSKGINGGGGGGRITFILPSEPILPLTYSCIQLERILVLGHYFPPSVSDLSCIVTAALKLSSNEALWGAEGSTSGFTTLYSLPVKTSFDVHLASAAVESIIDINVSSFDLQQDQENKLIELKRNLPSLLQRLLQYCKHAAHISVMIPTSQYCSTSSTGNNKKNQPSSYDNDFHPSLRLCGIAMEIYRQRLTLESPGLNRRRLHSSLLRTMGEVKTRNKVLTSRGPLCLAMVMLRWGLLEGGFDTAIELLCTSSVGLQPDMKAMLIIPPALEIFSLLQETLSPSNQHSSLQLCKTVTSCLGELVDLFSCSGVEGRILDRPRAAVAVCSCCLYLMALTGGEVLVRVMLPPVGLMLGYLNNLGESAGKAVVGVAEHCAKVLWGGGVIFDRPCEGNVTPNEKGANVSSMLHVEDEFGELGVDPTLLDILEGSCFQPPPSSSAQTTTESQLSLQSTWLSDVTLLSLNFAAPLQRLLVFEGSVKGLVHPNHPEIIQQRHDGGTVGRSDTTTKTVVDWPVVPLLRLQGIVSAAVCATIGTTEAATAAAASSTSMSNISSPSIGDGNITSSLLNVHISLLQMQQQQSQQHLGAYVSSLKLFGDYFQHNMARLRSVGFFMCTFQAATVTEKSETCSALLKSMVGHFSWVLLSGWVETALDPLMFPPNAFTKNEMKLCCGGGAMRRTTMASHHTLSDSDSEHTFYAFIRDGLVPFAHNLERAFTETSSELQGALNADGEYQFSKHNVEIREGMTIHEQVQAKSEAAALERALYLASVIRHLSRLWGKAKESAKAGQGSEAQRIKSCVVQVVRSSLQVMYRGLFQWHQQGSSNSSNRVYDSCSEYCCIIHAHLCYSYMGMVACSLPEALKGPPLSEMVGFLFGSLVSDPEGAPMLSSSVTAPYKQQHGCIPTPNRLIPVALRYLPDLLACCAQLQYNSRPISVWLAALSNRSIRWGVSNSRNSHGKELRMSFAAGLGGWKVIQQQPTHNSTSVDFMTSLEHIISKATPPIARIHQMRRSFMQHLDLPTALLEECERVTQTGGGGCLSSSPEVAVPVLHRSLLFLGLLFRSLGRGKVGVNDQELLQEAAPLLVPLYFIMRIQGLYGSHTAAIAFRASVRILDAKEIGGVNRNLATIAAMQTQTQPQNGEVAHLRSLVYCFARALPILVASSFERSDPSSTILTLREVEENRLKEAATAAGMCIPQDRIKDIDCLRDACPTASSSAWEEGTWCTSAELLCSVLVASPYHDVRQLLKNCILEVKQSTGF